MERITETSSIEVLRNANEGLERFFERFAGTPVVGTDEELQAMLRIEQTLKAVGALLENGSQASADAAVRQELAVYRRNLVRLRHELGLMANCTSEARGRLVTRATHLQAARAWCAASRGIR